jgi:hypothetical protein
MAELLLKIKYGINWIKTCGKHKICWNHLRCNDRHWSSRILLGGLAFRLPSHHRNENIECIDTGCRDLFCVEAVPQNARGLAELLPGNERRFLGVSCWYGNLFRCTLFYFQLDRGLYESVIRYEPMGRYLTVYMACFAVATEGAISGAFATYLLMNWMKTDKV